MLESNEKVRVVIAAPLAPELCDRIAAVERKLDKDPVAQKRLAAARVPAGKTLLVATHRPAPLDLAERLIILDRGKIVADGPRTEVLNAVGRGQIRRQPAMEVAS